MRKLISVKVAVYGILFLLSALLIFHILMVLRLLPAKIVWGGNLESNRQIYSFEMVSLFLNVLMILVIINFINPKKETFKRWSVFILIMFIYFLINTIANIFSVSLMETLIFTPFSLILALFCLRLFLECKDLTLRSKN